MNTDKTVEFQNQSQIDDYSNLGPISFGPWTSHIWRSDPRHMAFLMSRYKFCAKILEGKKSALEVGCGDAAGMPIVGQTVPRIHGIDFEPLVLQDAKARFAKEGVDRFTFSVHDISKQPVDSKFEAAYSLDVIEHVPAELENLFVLNIVKSLAQNGVFILGTPNIEAARFASPASAAGHINLKSGKSLKSLLEPYFHNVFSFGMNDEVVHTGYSPMAHYLFAVAAGVKSDSTLWN